MVSVGRRSMIGALVVTALIVAGCAVPRTRWVAPTAGASGPTATPSRDGLLAWQPCPELAQEVAHRRIPNVTFDCTKIKVPQDWATAKDGKPSDGKTFDLALVRARAGGQQSRIGSLVVNPGGPGGSGVDVAVYLAAGLPTEVLRRFDLIGFDPRGVSRSTPVKCFSDADLDAYFAADPDPVDQATYDSYVALTRRMAQSCGDKYGDALRLFSTEQAARDIDAVRAAVGDEKLTYLGYSYGTLLGAVYAQLFPTRIRALVLDGAVDPTQNSVQAAEGQAKGFELAFEHFVSWCRGNPTRCPIGPDARAAVTGAIADARRAPVRGAGGREATAGWVFTALISSLYTEQGWLQLAAAIDGLKRGNPNGVFDLADQYAERDSAGHYSNLFDANAAVNCTDDDATPGLDRMRALQSEWRSRYPLFGASLSLNLLCGQWPGKRDPFPTGAATGAPPIVVVGTTGDPATPYEQTAKLAKMLGVGRVLTWDGEGHTAYPQTRCIADAVDRYLIQLQPPAEGTTCPR
jgi:pimeloyl-ACP methyl ester carboxylesterase